jgi:hypothetical protein
MWFEFYGELFVTFRDFYTILAKENSPGCGCQAIEPGLSSETKARVVKETGNHYKVMGGSEDHPDLKASPHYL